MHRVERSRGTVVHTYLGQPGTAADDRDAVLVRSSTPTYRADANSWQLGRIAACDFRDPADVVVTPWRPVRRNVFYLGLQLAGRGSLTQRSCDGRERSVELTAGGMVVYSHDQPFRLSLAGPYHYLVLELVPAELGLDERGLRHAAVNAELAATPSACLLAGLLGELPDQLPRLGTISRFETADVVATLLSGGLRSLHDVSPPADRLFDEVLSWIEERLHDPDLAPDAIASAHHISTRYLHKVFSRHEVTVAGYVRARRLELLRRDLGDPAKALEPVSALARRRGILDPSYLSKAFRSRYQVSPREYRNRLAER
ncbi:helix-turn-helix domain-containing protein [Pseudonocardia sp. CA-107938]|uniref:helix-turn-helix domain-containing protein n=1 Tax=Pseudonocardia sp. CA-107938 TaxID=3240021 RepID=UPI003D93B2D1